MLGNYHMCRRQLVCDWKPTCNALYIYIYTSNLNIASGNSAYLYHCGMYNIARFENSKTMYKIKVRIHSVRYHRKREIKWVDRSLDSGAVMIKVASRANNCRALGTLRLLERTEHLREPGKMDRHKENPWSKQSWDIISINRVTAKQKGGENQRKRKRKSLPIEHSLEY